MKDLFVEFEVRTVVECTRVRQLSVYLGKGELGLPQEVVDHLHGLSDAEIEEYLERELYDKDLNWPYGVLVTEVSNSYVDFDEDEKEVVESVELLYVDRVDDEEDEEED